MELPAFRLNDTLSGIVAEQRKEIVSLNNTVERDILNEVPTDLLYTIIISGIRRAGKSDVG